jgi:hypothetical protein
MYLKPLGKALYYGQAMQSGKTATPPQPPPQPMADGYASSPGVSKVRKPKRKLSTLQQAIMQKRGH